MVFNEIKTLNEENLELQENSIYDETVYKLTDLIEVVAINELNLVLIEKIHGVSHLIESLLFYRVVAKNDNI
jgi:hypothetical protein